MTPARADSSYQIVALLAARLPGTSRARLTAHVDGLNLTAAHTTGLLRYLESHPDAMISGAATGPAALRALLDVLATEHPVVQPRPLPRLRSTQTLGPVGRRRVR